MKQNIGLVSVASILALTLAASISFGADTMKSKAPKIEWTNLQRENMAKMHEDMATCLRSSKTPKECHADMKMACKNMGKDVCPMMHEKGRHMMDGEY